LWLTFEVGIGADMADHQFAKWTRAYNLSWATIWRSCFYAIEKQVLQNPLCVETL
jgi:hypothetical protein